MRNWVNLWGFIFFFKKVLPSRNLFQEDLSLSICMMVFILLSQSSSEPTWLIVFCSCWQGLMMLLLMYVITGIISEGANYFSIHLRGCCRTGYDFWVQNYADQCLKIMLQKLFDLTSSLTVGNDWVIRINEHGKQTLLCVSHKTEK